MKKEIIKNKLKKIQVITPLALAGHGKDYIVDLIQQTTERKTQPLSFSDGMKKMMVKAANDIFINNIIELLEPEEREQFKTESEDDIYKLFEYLKNNKPNIKVFNNINMRELMIFIMGDSFILNIDKNFKVKLACQEAIELLNKDPDTLFVANSTRYEEELFFTFAMNQYDNPKQFLKDYIAHYNVSDFSQRNISTNMDIRLNAELLPHEVEFLHQLYQQIEQANSTFQKYTKNNPDFEAFIQRQEKDYLSKSDFDKVFDYGVIHIFRPLLPRTNNLNNKNLDTNIKEFTGINDEELSLIKEQYEHFNIDFNSENIHQFGFLRSNPLDPSENVLDKYKPIAVLNHKSITPNSLIEQLCKIDKKVQNKKPKR